MSGSICAASPSRKISTSMSGKDGQILKDEQKRTPLRNVTNSKKLGLISSSGPVRVPIKEKTPSKIVKTQPAGHFMLPTESSKTNVVAPKNNSNLSSNNQNNVSTPLRRPKQGSDHATPTSVKRNGYSPMQSPATHAKVNKIEFQNLLTPPRNEKIVKKSVGSKLTVNKPHSISNNKVAVSPAAAHHAESKIKSHIDGKAPGRLHLKVNAAAVPSQIKMNQKPFVLATTSAAQQQLHLQRGNITRPAVQKQKSNKILLRSDSQQSIMSEVSSVRFENSIVEVSVNASFDETNNTSSISDVYANNTTSLLSTGLVSLWDEIQEQTSIPFYHDTTLLERQPPALFEDSFTDILSHVPLQSTSAFIPINGTSTVLLPRSDLVDIREDDEDTLLSSYDDSSLNMARIITDIRDLSLGGEQDSEGGGGFDILQNNTSTTPVTSSFCHGLLLFGPDASCSVIEPNINDIAFIAPSSAENSIEHNPDISSSMDSLKSSIDLNVRIEDILIDENDEHRPVFALAATTDLDQQLAERDDDPVARILVTGMKSPLPQAKYLFRPISPFEEFKGNTL